MTAVTNLNGKKFGRLQVKRRAENNKHNKAMWECECDCGNLSRVVSSRLITGHTKSCGCLGREKLKESRITHHKTGTKIYRIWRNMLTRCYNPNTKQYNDYGGRGIKVCERWHTFENFYEDMGNCPDGLSIDRINNDGNYCPENCTWSTFMEQRWNSRKPKNGKNKYLNIYFNKIHKNWQVFFMRNKKHHWVGAFSTEQDALTAKTTYLSNMEGI